MKVVTGETIQSIVKQMQALEKFHYEAIDRITKVEKMADGSVLVSQSEYEIFHDDCVEHFYYVFMKQGDEL